MIARLEHINGTLTLTGQGVSRAIVSFLYTALRNHTESLDLEDDSADACSELLQDINNLLSDWRALDDKEKDKEIIKSITDRLYQDCRWSSGPDGTPTTTVAWGA